MPNTAGYGGKTSGDFHAAGPTEQTGNKKTSKTKKQNEVKGRRLLFRSGLLSRCTQQGRTRNTQTRIKLKITVFNQSKQGKTGQDKARLTQTGTPGVTSRPDEKELNRQELNTQGN